MRREGARTYNVHEATAVFAKFAVQELFKGAVQSKLKFSPSATHPDVDGGCGDII